MAKIKKRKLSWKASSSPQVTGYKLYWSDNGNVSYDSKYALLGNVTQIVLPDEIEAFLPGDGPIELAITAIDELGNESDMITLVAPYQFSVPKAPTALRIEALEEFHMTRGSQDKSDRSAQTSRPQDNEPQTFERKVI